MKKGNKLKASFYLSDDVVRVAQDLLGKKLCSYINGVYTSGIIVETEAYSGRNDKACHAHLGRFTKRTSTMYQKGGTAYIYLCYGIHHLFNVVTNVEGIADAVLVRALMPTEGLDEMRNRVKTKQADYKLCAGPGKLTKALGINKVRNGIYLASSSDTWIENDLDVQASEIVTTTRIGIDYAEEDALLPWRFYLKGNKSVSKY